MILPFVLHSENNLFVLGKNERVIDLLTLEIGNDLKRLVFLSMSYQPTGRLGEPGHGREQDDYEDELKGEGEPPRGRAGNVRERKGYPVREGEAGNVQDHLDDDQFPSPFDLRCFRLPDRSRGRIDSVSDSGNDSARYHLSYAIGRDLNDGADGHDGRAD